MASDSMDIDMDLDMDPELARYQAEAAQLSAVRGAEELQK